MIAIALTDGRTIAIAVATLVGLIFHEFTLAAAKINAGYDRCHPWVLPTTCLSILPTLALVWACRKINRPSVSASAAGILVVGIPLLVNALGTYISLNVGMIGSP